MELEGLIFDVTTSAVRFRIDRVITKFEAAPDNTLAVKQWCEITFLYGKRGEKSMEISMDTLLENINKGVLTNPFQYGH